jgi:hypothetical protein
VVNVGDDGYISDLHNLWSPMEFFPFPAGLAYFVGALSDGSTYLRAVLEVQNYAKIAGFPSRSVLLGRNNNKATFVPGCDCGGGEVWRGGRKGDR